MTAERRIEQGRKYLHALNSLSIDQWPRQLDQALVEIRNGRSEPAHFALLHPEILEHFFPAALVSSIRGRRTFDSSNPLSKECASALIWGYECPITQSETVHADHLFPYAFGGPSEPSNMVILCERHNSVKSSDVHLYPSWNDSPAWLVGALKARRSALDAYPEAGRQPIPK